MMNKLAIAMIVASVSALPMASAYAQSSNSTNPPAAQNGNDASGVKPTDSNGMPANCREGDAACSKTDPNKPAGGAMGTTGGGSGGAMGTSGTNGAEGSQGMGNSSPNKDGSANSPKCQVGDTACDTNGGRGGTAPAK